MRYMAYGHRYSEKYLRIVAKDIYSWTRRNPIRAKLLSIGDHVYVKAEKHISVTVSAREQDIGPDVLIREVDLQEIEVILPTLNHWEKFGDFASTPVWLEQAIAYADCREDYDNLHDCYENRFTLTQLSTVLNRSVESLVAEIRSAKTTTVGPAKSILGLCVIDQSLPDPELWLVDIRAYAISVLAEELFPNGA